MNELLNGRVLCALAAFAISAACDETAKVDGTVCYGLCPTCADGGEPYTEQLCIEGIATEEECFETLEAECGGGLAVLGGGYVFDEACHSCDNDCVEYGTPLAAPNIYLYPEQTTEVAVLLVRPTGAEIIASQPAYGDGWNVTVDPDGTIDGAYDYLFYEALFDEELVEERGWAVDGQAIMPWFEETLATYGFAPNEIADFVAYWATRLPVAPCYLVFPQDAAAMAEIINLVIAPTPASELRVWFVVRPTATCSAPQAPVIPAFHREGFTVAEWGVMVK